MTMEQSRARIFDAMIWEAALCFSLPTWMLVGNSAWPANNPYRFAATVLAGATAALLLCHIVPAFFAHDITNCQSGPLWFVECVVKAWVSIGAAASLIWLARAIGQSFLWGRFDEKFLLGLGAVAAVSMALFVVAARVRWQTMIAGILGLLGLIFIVISVVAQASGLWVQNAHLESEAPLGNNWEVFKAILLASAPASVFALRLGKAGTTRRVMAWTGVFGIWVPIITSTTMVALAKTGGVRQYWRPSVPIGAEQAFIWFVPTVSADFRAPTIVLLFVALVASIFWLRELLGQPVWSRNSSFLLAIVGVIGFWLTFTDDFSFWGYYLPWCWSILLASLLYGGWKVATVRWRNLPKGRANFKAT
jgi:hypothetical protein